MKREDVIYESWDEWITAEMAAGAENTHIIYERTGVTPKQIERISKEWIHALHLLKWKTEKIKAFMPIVKEYGYSLSQLLSAGKLTLTDDELLYVLMGFVPYVWQDRILKLTGAHPDYWFFGRVGRGGGKSELMAVDQDRYLFRAKGYPYLGGIVSKSEKLARHIFGRSKFYILTRPLFSWCVIRKTQDEVELDTGAQMIVCPAGARGWHFNRLGLDEVAYQKEDDIAAVEPAVRSKRGSIFAISTPNGTGNWFYVKCESKNPNYITVKLPSTANPNITDADLASVKAEYPEHYFKQEYMAEWVDWTGNAFSPDEIEDMMALEHQTQKEFGEELNVYCGGLDLGHYPDETVLMIGHQTPSKHIIIDYCQEWSQKDYNVIVEEIHNNIAPRFNLSSLAIDAIGAGEAVVQMFPQDAHYHIIPVRQDIKYLMSAYLSVKFQLERRRLHMFKHTKTKKQLIELIMKETQSGKRPIHPDNPESHDDTYSALSMLIQEHWPLYQQPQLYLLTSTLKHY
jgi:hypothetical protein